MLRYKTSLNKCKGPKSYRTASNGIKLQRIKKKRYLKYSDIWKLKTLQIIHGSKQRSQQKSENILTEWKGKRKRNKKHMATYKSISPCS